MLAILCSGVDIRVFKTHSPRSVLTSRCLNVYAMVYNYRKILGPVKAAKLGVSKYIMLMHPCDCPALQVGANIIWAHIIWAHVAFSV